MKKTFLAELYVQRLRALDYILKVMKGRGIEYQLCDPALYEEETEDDIYDLPRGYTVGKYGNYDEFPLVMININEKNELAFVGIPVIAEGVDEDQNFTPDDLSTDVICTVADLVANLENGTAFDKFIENADMPQN